jgi:DNA-binding CsgD family transcriptional regulator/ArsR family metal-binding transcriptional regulator
MVVEAIKLRDHGLVLDAGGPLAKPGGASSGAMMAGFQFNAEVAPLFPYINAVAQGARLFQNPNFIRFVFQEHLCGLYPLSGVASPFYQSREAVLFVEHLLAFLNDLRLRLDEIVPKYTIFRRVSVVDIIRLLPRNNCRECGFATCLAFAAAVSIQEARPDWCPHLGAPLMEQKVYPVFDGQGRVSSTVTIEVDPAAMGARPAPETEAFRPQAASVKNGPDQTEGGLLSETLTPREIEVLRLVSRGATNREISRRLKISPHTVKSHVTHIFNKLGVNDRTLAAVWAAHLGLV